MAGALSPLRRQDVRSLKRYEPPALDQNAPIARTRLRKMETPTETLPPP